MNPTQPNAAFYIFLPLLFLYAKDIHSHLHVHLSAALLSFLTT